MHFFLESIFFGVLNKQYCNGTRINKFLILMNTALIPSSLLIMKKDMYPNTAEINQ